MGALTPALNAAFVVVMTVVITWYMRDRFSEVDRRFAEQKQDTAARFAEVKDEMRELRTAVDALRSDVTHIALAVGAQHRPDTA